jgi:hypothetical protein
MISIIVCSVDDILFATFSASVKATIGIAFEIIRIDNRKNEFSICSAYNEGAKRANYEILCFAHEDIEMKSMNWGEVLSESLADRTVGLLGVIGICFYNLFPFGWLDLNELEGQLHVGALPGKPKHVHIRFQSQNTAEVAGIDGMFMATRKEIIQQFPFSEQDLKGFHGYDIDLAMKVRTAYRIVVSRKILLTHGSGGNYNQAYHDALTILDRKWAGHFPIYINKYSRKELQQVKMRSLSKYMSGQMSPKEKLFRTIRCIRYAQKHHFLPDWLRHISSSRKWAVEENQ